MPDAYLMHRPTPQLAYDLQAVELTGHWTPGRKAIALELIRRGALTIAEACARYRLSPEEIVSWRVRDEAHGRAGLCVTKIQEIRR